MQESTAPQEVITRKQAKNDLLKFYYTGSPCKRGHLSLRRTIDSSCLACNWVLRNRPEERQKNNERAAKWYAENTDRAAAAMKDYRVRNRQTLAENGAIYRARNKERITNIQAAYRVNKKEELGLKARESYRVIGGVRWTKVLSGNAQKRAKKLGVPFDKDAVMSYLSNPPTHCPVFGCKLETGKKWGMQCDSAPTLDRIVPRLGYVVGNLALISWRANRLKSNASADELRLIVAWLDSVAETKTSIAA